MADSSSKLTSPADDHGTRDMAQDLDDWPSVLDELERQTQASGENESKSATLTNETDDRHAGTKTSGTSTAIAASDPNTTMAAGSTGPGAETDGADTGHTGIADELAILDQAIAELDQASNTISTVASEIEFEVPADDSDDAIPVLDDVVTVANSATPAPQADDEADIPTLGESAIVVHPPASPAPVTTPPDTDEHEALLSELEVIAQDLNTATDAAPEQTEAATPPGSGESNPAAGKTSPGNTSSLSEFSDSELEQLPALATEPGTAPAPSSGQTNNTSEAAPANTAGGTNLQAALSQRIESLVCEAIEALSDELQQQLAQRVETLLLEAIDRALPELMEQLAENLRQQVHNHLQQQLSRLIGDMLGGIQISNKP